MQKAFPYLYTNYGRYITKLRALPSNIDGLKIVHRRLLLSLYDIASQKKVKSAKVIGHAIGTYHPHTDKGTYDTLVKLVENNYAFGQGNWGSHGIKKSGAAAMRYTEVKLAPWVKDLAFKYISYVPWFESELDPEPAALPSPLPIGLIGDGCISGISFHHTVIPRYKIGDLAKRLEFIINVWGEKTYRINPELKDIDIDENQYGPCIEPNFKNCINKASKIKFYEILMNGKSDFQVIPNGTINIDKTISILGKAPNMTFSKLETAIDGKKLSVKKLIDASGNGSDPYQINIIIRPNKKSENLIILFKNIWSNYLISTFFARCLFTDNEGKAIQYGIDEILLKNFHYYLSAVKTKRIQDCEKLITEKFNIAIIKIIRKIIKTINTTSISHVLNEFHKNPIKSIQLQKFNNETNNWYNVDAEITDDYIINICQTKSISKLINVNKDENIIDQKILLSQQTIKNTKNDCVKQVSDLKGA